MTPHQTERIKSIRQHCRTSSPLQKRQSSSEASNNRRVQPVPNQRQMFHFNSTYINIYVFMKIQSSVTDISFGFLVFPFYPMHTFNVFRCPHGQLAGWPNSKHVLDTNRTQQWGWNHLMPSQALAKLPDLVTNHYKDQGYKPPFRVFTGFPPVLQRFSRIISLKNAANVNLTSLNKMTRLCTIPQ